MAEGRRREAWYHTALLAAMQAEMNRDHKRRHHPFRESDFHPDGAGAYAQAKLVTAKMTASDREMLRQAFPGKKK
jgi:hypothetical protein